MVSTDVLEVLAKEFYYAYQKIMIDAMPETNEKEIEEKKKAKESLKQTAEEEWNARREALQDKHSLDAQIKLAYQEEQDRDVYKRQSAPSSISPLSLNSRIDGFLTTNCIL